MKRPTVAKLAIFMCLLFAMPISILGQRIAVLEFSAGVGVSIGDVDGLSSIFTTYFHPSNYTLVERTEVDRVISEQRFQRSAMTESQMVRIGKILNLSKIVIGKINIIGGEYNVDVRVVDVESGTITATAGASFPQGSYRNNMRTLAENLSQKLSSPSSNYVSSEDTNTIPNHILSKLKRKPEPFTVALWGAGYDGNIYFADKETIIEIQKYPNYKRYLTPIVVMVTGGEEAFGIDLNNATLDKINAATAEKKYGRKDNIVKFLTLPTVKQAEQLW